MKILVLTSRYTATRDIIGEDFGRQTRLFSALKKLGHDIDFLCADYRKFENRNEQFHGINVKIRPFGIFYFFGFISCLKNILKKNKYDFIVASSDPLWGAIGYFFSRKFKIKFVYDLHDNYEVYATYRLPFFRHLDNYILRNADIITTVSYALKNKISNLRKDKVFVVQNGVDTDLFRPMNKKYCREKLQLPLNSKIIAYAGSIQRTQGIDLLIDAFLELKKEISNVYLVIAGRFYGNEHEFINLKKDGIIYLGSISQKKVVELINAANVVAVPNPKNNFTQYCFPYKVVEYMACNTPIVATDIGDIGMLLKNFKNSFCRENDKDDMIKKIKIQLSKNKINYRAKLKNSWDQIASKLDGILKDF